MKHLTKLFCLFILLHVSIDHSAYAFDLCPTLQIWGQDNTCASKTEGYSINYDRYSGITWTVSGTSNPEITSVAGVNLSAIRSGLGIPANVGIVYLHVDREGAVDIKLNANVTLGINFFTKGAPIKLGLQANLAIAVNVVQLIDQIAFGFNKAENIGVKYNNKGVASVFTSITDTKANGTIGLKNCGGQSQSRQITVRESASNVTPPTIQLNFPTPVNPCTTSSLSVQATYVHDMFYYWTVEDGTIIGSAGGINQSTLQIGGFTSTGSKLVRLTLTDACGNTISSATVVQVVDPVSQLKINNLPIATINTSGAYVTGCSEGQYGMNVSIEPYVSSIARYTVTLPPGWLDESKTPKSTVMVGTRLQRTYEANDLRYFYIKSDNLYDFGPGGTINVSIKTGCSVNAISASLSMSSALSVTLPDQNSCSANVPLQPSIVGGLAPYSLTWWTSSNAVLANTQTASPTINNTLDGKTYGLKNVTVQVRDASGCIAQDDGLINILGGVTAGDNTVSGWLSGHINPQQLAGVASNIVKSNSSYIYFVYNDASGFKQIYKYGFNNVLQKWILAFTGITDVAQIDNNSLQFIRCGTFDLLFYINDQGKLAYRIMDLNTGNPAASATTPRVFDDIEPTDYQYGYQVRYVAGNIFQIVWRDFFTKEIKSLEASNTIFGNLQIDQSSRRTIVDATPGRIRYDMDFKNNRICYFKDDGGLYSKEMTVGSVEVKLNGFSNNDYASTVTDMRFDGDGNLFYVASGDLYMVQFNAQGNFQGIFQIETTDNVLPSSIASGANGAIDINLSTNTIYYAGYNGNMYQIYRKPTYTQNAPVFGVIKATPLSFNDNVASSITIQHPNVFYRSTNNQVYNLFFISNDPACQPQYLRTASTAVDTDRVNLDADGDGVHLKKIPTTFEAQAHQKSLAYPNPVQDQLHIVSAMGALRKVQVFTIDGSLLQEIPVSEEAVTIATGEWTTGLYIVRLTNAQGIIESIKVNK
jgi:hypothetical protein